MTMTMSQTSQVLLVRVGASTKDVMGSFDLIGNRRVTGNPPNAKIFCIGFHQRLSFKFF